MEENGILELLEFWKMEFLWIVEEGKKENRKRKRKWKREIILLEEKVKINESGGFPGLGLSLIHI